MYEMVTALRPIDGDSSWAVMNAHLNQIPRSPITINQSVPPALSLTILKALEKDPTTDSKAQASSQTHCNRSETEYLGPSIGL